MYNCFRTQPRKALMNNLRGLIVLLALRLSVCLYANPIKIIGTYDLNKNNLNEITKRMSGWQLESFKESYKHKVKSGISLFKKEDLK